MDPHLADYYAQELTHLKGVCAEFAEKHAKVGQRLDLSSDAKHLSRDPYVLMLLQGVAFLAARVRYQLDADFPRFSQTLLEIVYPHFLRPVPSMAMVGFQPREGDRGLATGFEIPRHTVLRAAMGKAERTACQFATAHPVRLWPFSLSGVDYLSSRTVGQLGEALPDKVRAALRFRFEMHGNLAFRQIAGDGVKIPGCNRIEVHLREDGQGCLRGPSQRVLALYEHILRHGIGLALQWGPSERKQTRILPRSSLRRVGFAPQEALLPIDDRTFQGYRLLREYFAFPDRFFFVAFDGLREALADCAEPELDLSVLLCEEEPAFDEAARPATDRWLDHEKRFALFATPCVNLFRHDFPRLDLSDRHSEYRIGADLEYEVYALEAVTGYGSAGEPREFRPLYSVHDNEAVLAGYYTAHRRPRDLSPGERGASYVGSELCLTLVDPSEAPVPNSLTQLGVSAWCTNRHLGHRITVGQGATDFVPIDFSGPFLPEIRCLSGPTPPIAPPLEGSAGWGLIDGLALNYRSLADQDPRRCAAALRGVLRHHLEESRSLLARQLQGLSSVQVTAQTRRVPCPGPPVFARGLEVTVLFDEARFEGTGPFLLGAVLEDFFSRYASINSFTETTIKSVQRGKLITWPARYGTRPIF